MLRLLSHVHIVCRHTLDFKFEQPFLEPIYISDVLENTFWSVLKYDGPLLRNWIKQIKCSQSCHIHIKTVPGLHLILLLIAFRT